MHSAASTSLLLNADARIYIRPCFSSQLLMLALPSTCLLQPGAFLARCFLAVCLHSQLTCPGTLTVAGQG